MCAQASEPRPSGNIGSQVVQFITKATIVLTLYFGAKAVIAGEHDGR